MTSGKANTPASGTKGNANSNVAKAPVHGTVPASGTKGNANSNAAKAPVPGTAPVSGTKGNVNSNAAKALDQGKHGAGKVPPTQQHSEGNGSPGLATDDWSAQLFDSRTFTREFPKAFFCPCLSIRDILDRIDQKGIKSPFGKLTGKRYLAIFGLSMLLLAGVEVGSALVGMTGPVFWSEPDMIPLRGGMASSLPFKYQVTLVTAMCILISWVLTFLVLKAIRDHLKVKESTISTFAKSGCSPDGTFCMLPFFLVQVKRHLDMDGGYPVVGKGAKMASPKNGPKGHKAGAGSPVQVGAHGGTLKTNPDSKTNKMPGGGTQKTNPVIKTDKLPGGGTQKTNPVIKTDKMHGGVKK